MCVLTLFLSLTPKRKLFALLNFNIKYNLQIIADISIEIFVGFKKRKKTRKKNYMQRERGIHNCIIIIIIHQKKKKKSDACCLLIHY